VSLPEANVPPPGQVVLDHVGLFVPAMDPAAEALMRLGFRLTPLTPQRHRLAPNAPLVPAGTANRLAVLRRGYIEVLTAIADTPIARQLRAATGRYAGLHLIAFGTGHAEAARTQLAENGFAPQPVIDLERTVETVESREHVAAVRELVVSTLQDVRRLAVELRPAALDDFGLGPALQRLVDNYRQDRGTIVDLELRLGEGRLPADVETTMYRIVQEALTNIAKHASAARVSVLVTRKEDTAVVVVEDDGGGFDARDSTAGLGLSGMRERVALVGGRLRVETSPGSGTTIAAEVPLK